MKSERRLQAGGAHRKVCLPQTRLADELFRDFVDSRHRRKVEFVRFLFCNLTICTCVGLDFELATR